MDKLKVKTLQMNLRISIAYFITVSEVIQTSYAHQFTVRMTAFNHHACMITVHLLIVLITNDNDNDNQLCIQTKSNEKHHKGNINNTYKNTISTTFVPRRLIIL